MCSGIRAGVGTESPRSAEASKGKKIRGSYAVKTFLSTALIIVLGITGISLWGAVHAQRMAVSSRQIFIHGTPVCVMQQAGEIRASVGTCDSRGLDTPKDDPGNGKDPHGRTLTPIDPRQGLPPGHPPLDSTPDFEGERRILI